MAALDVIRRRWPDQDAVLARTRTDRPPAEPRDALDAGTIARLETDRWLRQMVLFIGRSMVLGEPERDQVAATLAAYYEPLGRRQVGVEIGVADLERVLSLPAWRKRYELFGVWVATEMLATLDGHDIAIHSTDGELRFGFGEARIAVVRSSQPAVALYAERRTPFDAPVGDGRVRSVQPDFGLWGEGREPEWCELVVEVKHYKRRAVRNFTDALTDYARAHPRAAVGLVNYGPVGSLELPNRRRA